MDRREFIRSSALSLGGLSLFGAAGLTSCGPNYNRISAETGMAYRKLGRTGIDVSVIALGCEGFMGKSAEEVRQDFDYAISRGVNFLDLYSSNPELRSNIGHALKGRRNRFVIQGHLGSAWENGQYLRTRELGKVTAAFEDELERLGTNYLDVGMIHYVDDDEDWKTVFEGEMIGYVLELRKKRRIRSIGLSTHNAGIALKAAESGIVDVIMFSLNPAYDFRFEDGKVTGVDKERASLYEVCEKNGVAIDVMKAFSGGNLLREEDSPFGRALTPVQCIEYALSRPGVAAVMCGAADRKELDADLAWCRATSREKDFISLISESGNAEWKGQCMYCTHCAPCSSGIDIAAVNKYLNLAKGKGEVPETVLDHYNLLDHHASECIECGKCEKRCPFDVRIMLNMKKAVGIFGI